MSAGFEVVQAKISGWVSPSRHGYGVYGIYFELYPHVVQRKCRCWRKKKNKRNHFNIKCISHVLDESVEITYKKQEDGIVTPLGTFVGSTLRAKRGEDVILVMDLFRIPQEGEAYYVSEMSAGLKTGVKVASLSGAFRIGTWGDIKLETTGLSPIMQECGVDNSELKAVLELRPVSSRPFMLANAKPRSGQVFSIEAFIQDGNAPASSGRMKASNQKHGQASGRLSLTQFTTWSGDGTSSQSNLLSWGRRSNSTTAIPADKLGPTSIEKLRQAKKDHVSRFCSMWTPDNWSKLWTNIWPEHEDNLMGKHDIVPLMEAEFRRDCVVFYNTLFPRSRQQSFLILRDAALEPSSKMCFKLVTSKLAQKIKAIIDTSQMQVHELQWSQSMAMLLASTHSKEYSGGSICTNQPTDDDGDAGDEPDSSRSFTLLPPESPRDLPLNSIRAASQCQLQSMDELPPRLSLGKVSDKSSDKEKKPSEIGKYSSPKSNDSGNGHLFIALPSKENSTETGVTALLLEGDSTIEVRSAKRLGAKSQTLSRDNLKDPRSNVSTSSAISQCGVQSVSTRSQLPSHNHSIGIMRGLSTPNGIFMDEYSPRIALLKRLFICFAHCGVHYSEVVDSSEIGDPWPYPLASVLGHGCRVLIRLEDVEGYEFINFLLTGDPNATDWKADGVPLPLKQRVAATHSVSIETDTGRLFERRLRVASATDVGQTLMDGMKKKHLGLDLPIGGVGNPSPMGGKYAIGFRGEILQLGAEEEKSSASLTEKAVAVARAVARRGSLIELEKSPKASAWAPTGSLELGEASTCRIMTDMQGGHMYIRIDDFGNQIESSSWAERDHEGTEEQEIRRELREKTPMDQISMRMIDMVRKVVKRNNRAGELLFSSNFEHLCKREWLRGSNNQGRQTTGPLTLLRVSSEPVLMKGETIGDEIDKAWVREVMFQSHHREALEPPPSATALHLLFAQYDPQSADLYGTANFKSFDDLFAELSEQKSQIIKHGQGIRRLVQPTIVQLCWKHLVLVLRYEIPIGKDSAVEKNSFIATRTRHQEQWQNAARRAIREELDIKSEFEQAMLGELNNSIAMSSDDKNNQDRPVHEKTITEKTTSPSYPGLLCEYKTHMVHFQIQDRFEDAWRRSGFIDNAKKTPDAARFGCDFVTMKNKKRLYWQWIPRTEAQQMQKFLNMGEDTLDERWAKYAFQANGLVRYPPTEFALAILLRRCGVDILKFGTDSYKPLRDFWVELTNEESYLQMSSGRPVRVAEALFVKLRWRPESDKDTEAEWQVLVQVSEQKADGKTKDTRKLLSTRKGKSETWEDSAIRCVVQDLCVSKSQLKNMLVHKTTAAYDNKASGYLFYEQKTESDSYPGLQCSYRTHLVTFRLKENFQAFVHPQTGKLKKLNSTTSFPSLAKVGRSSSERHETTEVTMCNDQCWKTKRTTAVGVKMLEFVWVEEWKLHDVKGAALWRDAEDRQERRHVCSVLLGLESAAPHHKSPFGGVHDASGKPKPISAVGNHKWSAFRLNNALQVPSDENGMRMRITRQNFYTLRKICKNIDLIDPVIDLLANSQQTHGREQLNQIYSEREFFKNILASNATQAKEVLRWMLDYREGHPTLALRASRVVSVSGPPRDDPHHIYL